MEVDAAQRNQAIARVQKHVGLNEDDAKSLVDAFLAGAVDRAFELVNGVSAVPTAMTTARADELRFTCERSGRILTEREVEVLFRVTSRTAKSTITTMMATYAEALRDHFLARMRADARVVKSGTNEAGLTWTLRFSEGHTFDLAWAEMQRLGLGVEAETNTAQRKVVIPRQLAGVGVLEQLEIPVPGEE